MMMHLEVRIRKSLSYMILSFRAMVHKQSKKTISHCSKEYIEIIGLKLLILEDVTRERGNYQETPFGNVF